ncbi:MAG: nucleoside hydrolase [Acidobacteriaceae bacterium]
MKSRVSLLLLIALLCCCRRELVAQQAASGPQKVIFDTDIGDDIDDAFALGLLLSSPEVQVLGVTTDFGDTDLRARLVERYLCEVGRSDIPVAAGPKVAAKSTFTQARWAERFPDQKWPDAVDFILKEIRKYPGQITLISVSPLHNVGALIERDPAAFRKLKRVVIMGGSIRRGYGDLGYGPIHGPEPEYNILMDIPAAQKLFTSGVPLYVMPLDSTQLKLDVSKRNVIFSQSKPLTDTLALLYHDWTASTQNPTPTLFDAMAAAYALRPDLCPTIPLHVVVDAKGFTREEPGPANAQVCLTSDADKFFHFYIRRILTEDLKPSAAASGCKATELP